jgi:hypothetical protein
MVVSRPFTQVDKSSAKDNFLTDQEKDISKFMMNEDKTYETYYLSTIFRSQTSQKHQQLRKDISEKPALDYILIMSLALFIIATILQAWIGN